MSIASFLRSEIEVGSFPAASWVVGDAGGVLERGAAGHAVAVPCRIAATEETIFDCASITKPLVTGTLTLRAVADGRLSLDDEYRGYTIRELLTHTSGLRDWLPLYASRDYLAAIERDGPLQPRGAGVIYSDLNFVLLYFALRELYGSYEEAAQTLIFDRLGLATATFHPSRALVPRIAATEWGQRFEAGMCAARSVLFNGFRSGLMWGETNDGNSYHAGGTCGNAGLFATAEEVHRIAQAFVRGELVPPELVREATRTIAGDRGLGWQTRGPGLSAESFGHNGFTGTSVWVERERIMVLLTNRIHPCAAPIPMQSVRAGFHREALALPAGAA